MNVLIVVHERAGGPLAAAARTHLPPGSRVMQARGIDEALARVRVIKFDALLVEPACAVDAFGRLQAEAPDAALVALVGPSDESAGFEALSHGAVEYVGYGELRSAAFARIMRSSVERRRLARAEQDRLRRERVEAIRRLSFGISHYFNNLFAIQLGYGRLMERSPQVSGLDRAHLEHVIGAIERARAITKHLVQFCNGGEPTEAPQDVNTVVREMEPGLRAMLGSGIELALELAPAVAPVLVERLALEQTVLALALNARDAMQGAGRVTIATRLDGAHVVLTVTDQGPGLAPNVERCLFEPFFTTKEVGEGTGMSLAAAHGIARAAGGFVAAASRLGRGTTVEVNLPHRAVNG